MGQSNNPEGTAQVSDREIIDTLRSLLEDSEKLAVPARDVAERLPIKKQAAGKRLNKLVKAGDTVSRFKGSQAWLYYIEDSQESEIIDTEMQQAGRGGEPNAAGKRLDEHGADLKAVHEANQQNRVNTALDIFGATLLWGGGGFVGLGVIGIILIAAMPPTAGMYSLGVALLISGFGGVGMVAVALVYRAAGNSASETQANDSVASPAEVKE